MNGFRSRKDQIESEFLRDLWNDLKLSCAVLPRGAKAKIKAALKNAAMVGAAEERHRTLGIIQECKTGTVFLVDDICAESVLKVLGYE